VRGIAPKSEITWTAPHKSTITKIEVVPREIVADYRVRSKNWVKAAIVAVGCSSMIQ
jgi:hypothetical protein